MKLINTFLINGIVLFIISITPIFAQNLSSAACGTPTNLHINNLTSTSGQLVWNSVANSTNYTVRFRPVGSTSWRRQPSQNTIEVITALIPNTLYEANVKSICSGIEGVYCSLFNFRTPSNISCAVPNVYYFASDSITSNTTKVSWKKIPEALRYNVQYRIRYSNSGWLTATTTVNSRLLSELNPLTQYEFKVQTVCSNGTSTFSLVGIFTTLRNTCDTPVNLSATDITTSTATLLWNSLTCATSYNLKYRQVGAVWNIVNLNSPTYYLNNLEEGTSYEFIVQGINQNGFTSIYSHPYVFSTASPTCGIPGNITLGSIAINQATLSWNAVPGASKYNVRYKLAGSLNWQTFTTDVNNAILTGLSPDNAYAYEVQTMCANSPGGFSTTSIFSTLPQYSNIIPVPDHIVICIMENKAYTQIFESIFTPNISNLSKDPKSALFLNSYGITHPSQPNYFHLFSGSNQGITNNELPSQHFTTPNLAKELINAGKTFIEYSEGLPEVGYDGASYGRYVRRHNPVANWMGTGANQVSSTLNQPYSNFPTNYNNLPTVSIVIPDLTNGMHDGYLGTALANGDNWFKNNMIPYIDWAKSNNSLFILTADEDDGSHNNHILTIFTGAMVMHGSYSQLITHYNILRTIEEMYGLNFIGATANVSSIHGCWTNGFRMSAKQTTSESPLTNENYSGWNIFPNPVYDELHATYNLIESADVSINIFNSTGSLIFEEKLGNIENGNHTYTIDVKEKKFPQGIYLMDIIYGNKKYTHRFLITQR